MNTGHQQLLKFPGCGPAQGHEPLVALQSRLGRNLLDVPQGRPSQRPERRRGRRVTEGSVSASRGN